MTAPRGIHRGTEARRMKTWVAIAASGVLAAVLLIAGCAKHASDAPPTVGNPPPRPSVTSSPSSSSDRLEAWQRENRELRDADKELKRKQLGLPPGSPTPLPTPAPKPGDQSSVTGPAPASADKLDVWRQTKQEFITAEQASVARQPSKWERSKEVKALQSVVIVPPAQDYNKLRSAPSRTLHPAPAKGITQIPSQAALQPVVDRNDSPFRSISSTDEMWIIAREKFLDSAPTDDLPGGGGLLAKIADQEVPVPLKHTDVQASISAYIATVEVTQQFHNPYNEKIEAVYVFPLPENAAVNEFIMVIGERRIRGIIRERAEAEQIYQAARAQGYTASLLTQERPNIFTQSVANIEPGKQIDVNIKYFHTLAYVDGWYEFVFPMVVGPRFNPPGSTHGVGAVGRGSAGRSQQKTEVQYLRPGERSGHDIAVRVEVDAGVKIEEALARTHLTTKQTPAPEKLVVTLNPSDSIPNKDFVLRYRVAGERIKSSLLTHRDERGGYFTLMLYPPDNLKSFSRQAMEMVFVLDCSGSMSGKPLEQAKTAIERALRHLQPDDTFQLINFSVRASQLGPRPLEATPENIRQGLKYLESLNSEGGTMMIEGIKAALDFPHDPKRLRFVSFMTDGYIGNEAEILGEVHRRLGDTRIFSFGVGSSVNRYLLDSMAKLGRGAVAYLGPQDSAAEVMDLFFARISHPAMTDLQIDWGAMQVSDVFPKRLPDLFVGRPVILTGKFKGHGTGAIRVTGKAGNGESEVRLAAKLDDRVATHKGLASVWARMKIADLADQATHVRGDELPREIKQVALDYGLMSAFTAFVAVDSSRQTAGAHGTTVPVAVPVPAGVKYQTTVGER
ncbi:MAG: VIT domain-containing protein [Verrucomicrobiota bacterium]